MREPMRPKSPDEWPILSSVDWAYIAGIIDADGCIAQMMSGPRHDYPTWYISVAQLAEAGLCQWLSDAFGGRCNDTTTKKRENPRQTLQWRLMRQEVVYEFLIEILPYLRVKKTVANKAISVLADRLYGQNGRLMT